MLRWWWWIHNFYILRWFDLPHKQEKRALWLDQDWGQQRPGRQWTSSGPDWGCVQWRWRWWPTCCPQPPPPSSGWSGWPAQWSGCVCTGWGSCAISQCLKIKWMDHYWISVSLIKVLVSWLFGVFQVITLFNLTSIVLICFHLQ